MLSTAASSSSSWEVFTEAKGYFIGANYGIEKNIYASARWLSASEVYGAPFEVDVMQLELNTRF